MAYRRAKIMIESFALFCPIDGCDGYVNNPINEHGTFVIGMDMPDVGAPLKCDFGHTSTMPQSFGFVGNVSGMVK